MESNICSTFGKISGIIEGISKLRGISVISEGGQVDKNKVMQLMLKNPGELTAEEKQILEYAKIVLGEDEYAKLKEQSIKKDNGQEIADNLKLKFGDTSIYNEPFSELANDISFMWGKADGGCKWLTGSLGIIDSLNATEDLFKFSKVEGNEAKTMLGANGIKLDGSQKIWQNGKTERIDVENFVPGKLPGNIHYHEPNNTKWYLDISEKIFYDKKGIPAPKKIQKLLKDKELIKNLNRGLKYLGEDKIK